MPATTRNRPYVIRILRSGRQAYTVRVTIKQGTPADDQVIERATSVLELGGLLA